MTDQLRLLCDSNPMCYGSSTSMLSILDHLVDAVCTALVRDVTAEVLAGDAAVADVISVDNKSPEAVRADVDLQQFDAVLAVSNQSNIELYCEAGLPVFFVDVLYWFGPRKDQPVWQLAEQTFVQWFPGVAERLEAGRYERPPVEIGPLRRPLPRAEGPRSGTLVQIGGARSRLIRPGVDSDFPRMVMDWLAELAPDLPKPITFAGGRDAIAIAGQHPAASQLRLVSLPYDVFLRELQSASCFVTTPGQGAVFEGLAAGVDMLLLPPQNPTQAAQLRIFEEAGLVVSGANLPELDPKFDMELFQRNEVELTPLVLESLQRLDNPAAVKRVLRHLRGQMASLGEHSGARASFTRLHGESGGKVVAAAIDQWWAKRTRSKRLAKVEVWER